MKKTHLLPVLLIICLTGSGAAAARGHRRHDAKVRYPHRHSAAAFFGFGATGEPGVGAGAEYQRFMDRKGRLAVVLPAAAYLGGGIGFEKRDDGGTTRVYGCYAAPGIRYHPFGSDRRADFGLGAAAILGLEHRRDAYSSPYSYQYTEFSGNGLLSGVTGQISVDVHPRNHATVFGVFVSGGYLFTQARTGAPVSGTGNGLYLLFGLRLGGYW